MSYCYFPIGGPFDAYFGWGSTGCTDSTGGQWQPMTTPANQQPIRAIEYFPNGTIKRIEYENSLRSA